MIFTQLLIFASLHFLFMHNQPVPSHLRFTVLDALRGFAVFGIFGTNMVASSLNLGEFNQPYFSLGKLDAGFSWFIQAFVEGKFYSIFSLLFGIGFGLQLSKHQGIGLDGLPVFKRRLWGLMIIGLLHMFFIWLGDILFLYAWLGFVLIGFRHKSDRWLINAAIFCLAIPVLLFPLRLLNANLHLGTPFFALLFGVGKLMDIDLQTLNPAAYFSAPGWSQYFKANVFGFLFRQADLFDQARPFKVFAMFLLGFWASRRSWHKHPENFLEMARPYMVWLLPVAVVVNMGMAAISWDHYYSGKPLGFLKSFLYFLGVVPLCLCYVYLFCKAWLSGRFSWLHGFTYVGRMALTNYLLHSILFMVLFRGPFFALAGKVGILALMVPVLVFFPLQIMFSKWWLQHYQYGPAEWVWRSFTYRKWQPLSRS